MTTFGERLRELRKKHNVKQKHLAEYIGVSERALRWYESGNREPTIAQLIQLADYFDVTLDYLVGRTDNH